MPRLTWLGAVVLAVLLWASASSQRALHHGDMQNATRRTANPAVVEPVTSQEPGTQRYPLQLASAASIMGPVNEFNPEHTIPNLTTDSVYAILYVDAQHFKTLASAVSACLATHTGGLIYDSIPEDFVSNPFGSGIGTSQPSVTVYLIPGASGNTWRTKVPIVVPYADRIIGTGRGDPSHNVTIQADPAFSSPCIVKAIIQLGDAAYSCSTAGATTGAFGTRIENLTIDANNVPKSVSLYSESANEQSGLDHVILENFVTAGILMDGTHSQADTNVAQNYDLSDLEVNCGTGCKASTILIHLIGNVGPQMVDTATLTSSASTPSNVVLQADNLDHGVFRNIHIEQGVIGIGLGTGGSVVNIGAVGTTCNNVVKCIDIAPGDARNIVLQNTLSIGTYAETIDDEKNLIAITEGDVGLYALTSGGTQITTSEQAPSVWRSGLRAPNLTDSGLTAGNCITVRMGGLLKGTPSGCPVVASVITTAATSDNVKIAGMTSSGHCSMAPTNVSAATNIATSYISAKAANRITLTHTATAGMTYDFVCTPN